MVAALGGMALAFAPGAIGETLSGFVTHVVQSHPEVREQIHRYRQTLQDHAIALSGWRPSLDLAATVGAGRRTAANTNDRQTDFTSAEGEISLTQNLFDGFDTRYAIRQAQARITSAAHQIVDTADNIALDAVQAYMDTLTERKLVELARHNVESHERILEQIRELGEKGITRRSDVEQTEGRLARARASLVAQQNNLEDALTELHNLAGYYLKPDQLVEQELSPPRADLGLEALIDAALAQHPAIASAKANIEAAQANHRRSKRTDLPSLDLQLRQSIGNDADGPTGNSRDGSVLLSLRYNLYSGGANRAEQRKRASAVQEQKAFLDRVRRQVVDSVRLAGTAELALRGQLRFLVQHSEKSLETVELYREEYTLLRRDLLDVLDAEGELNRALVAEAEARYDAIIASYRVNEGTGELLEAFGVEVEILENDVRIGGLKGNAIDTAEIPTDSDSDGKPDQTDHCQRSVGQQTNDLGCGVRLQLDFEYRPDQQYFRAADDRFLTDSNTPLALQKSMLLANDEASGRVFRSIRRLGDPAFGTVSKDEDGNVTYRPAKDFVGTDTFTYVVGDRRARNATAKVEVDVGLARTGADERLAFRYREEGLTPTSQQVFDNVVARLKREPDLRISLTTHTDSVGSRAYNLRLSNARAKALKNRFIAAGIAAHRIDAAGEGEAAPIATNRTEAGRAANRRAEIRYLR